MKLDEIAQSLRDDDARIILAYAFNATGKTQLSVAFKNATKLDDGRHMGVYYNAFSEDLFVWDNDEDNDGANVRLTVLPSSLSKFHALLTEDNIRDKLNVYKPKFGFELKLHDDDPEKGIESISFFIPNQNPDVPQPPIKISRGEERIFVWCFFLALFEVEGWADEQSNHFFIDDPVSSLDDHHIFITAETLFELIEKHYKRRKIIITTHHAGLYSILSGWLRKGDQRQRFEKLVKICILSGKSGDLSLEKDKDDVHLYHLRLLQILDKATKANDLRSYHFALLRQVLENVASFLGKGQFGYVLGQIGIDDANDTADIINTLSHKRVYYYESDHLVPDRRRMFETVLTKLQEKYNFVLHAE
ncbi:AAA family ATPase [Paraburkholderia sacchari]|uniref:AAA family ATPase n=1 Tax=Paraburkholderia sacchari TaxID=159450 RepID=UPI0005444E04|nr:AAA family ATPase [Paraburkholderia sacchari]NLP61219.1 AAA family ATPase [Paraburkholderia sacchari]